MVRRSAGNRKMQRAAIIARFHCGALPTRSHKLIRDLLPDEQRNMIRLSAILRLANALDAAHDGQIRRLRIERAIRQAAQQWILAKTASAAETRTAAHARRRLRRWKSHRKTVAAERYCWKRYCEVR